MPLTLEQKRRYSPIATIDPSTLPGALAILDANQSVYSDAGVTPAVDGDSVERWTDIGGSGLYFQQLTAGFQPTYETGAKGGRNALVFVETSSQGLSNDATDASPSPVIISGKVQTIVTVHLTSAVVGHRTIVGADRAAAGLGAFYHKSSNPDGVAEIAVPSSSGSNVDSQVMQTSQDIWSVHTSTIDHDSKTLRTYTGRGLISEETFTSTFAEVSGKGTAIGNGYYNNNRVDFFGGKIGYVALFDTVLDEDTVAGVAAYLEDLFSMTPSGDYVFPSFSKQASSLYVNQGADAANWTSRPRSYIPDPSTQGVRDPNFIYDELLDKYIMVHTNANLFEDAQEFVVAESTDLIRFDHVAFADCSSVANGSPGNNKVWAPEIFKDPISGEVFVFVSISNSGTSNLAGYVLQCLDKSTYASWSAPTPLVVNNLANPSNNIDWFVLHDGTQYSMFFKDEVVKQTQIATADTFPTEWTVQTVGDWAGWQAQEGSLEGACVIPFNGTWRIFLDRLGLDYFYSDAATTDLQGAWSALTPISDDLENGNNIQHGSVFDLSIVYPTDQPPEFDTPPYDNAANYDYGDSINISAQFSVVGSPNPTYSVLSGALPNGTSLNTSTGDIIGTLTELGAISFTIRAENSEGLSDGAVSFTVSAVVPAFDSPAYDNAPSYDYGDAVSLTPALTVAGSPAPTFSVASGSLPSGLSINSSSGVVTGTLGDVGAFSFTVRAENAGGFSDAVVSFSVAAIAPVFDTPGYDHLAEYTKGDPISIDPQFSTPPQPGATFSVTAGTLPSELTLDTATGNISGTLDSTGGQSFSITCSNSGGSDVEAISFTVNAAPNVSYFYSSKYLINEPMSIVPVINEGFPLPTFSLFSGALPSGTSLNTTTGEISGTPDTLESVSFTIRAENAGGLDDSAVLFDVVAEIEYSTESGGLSIGFKIGF